MTLDRRNLLALRVRVRALVALSEADPPAELGDRLLKEAPDRGWGALAHGAYHVLRGERVQGIRHERPTFRRSARGAMMSPSMC